MDFVCRGVVGAKGAATAVLEAGASSMPPTLEEVAEGCEAGNER